MQTMKAQALAVLEALPDTVDIDEIIKELQRSKDTLPFIFSPQTLCFPDKSDYCRRGTEPSEFESAQ
jgi:hypothetical protein